MGSIKWQYKKLRCVINGLHGFLPCKRIGNSLCIHVGELANMSKFLSSMWNTTVNDICTLKCHKQCLQTYKQCLGADWTSILSNLTHYKKWYCTFANCKWFSHSHRWTKKIFPKMILHIWRPESGLFIHMGEGKIDIAHLWG